MSTPVVRLPHLCGRITSLARFGALAITLASACTGPQDEAAPGSTSDPGGSTTDRPDPSGSGTSEGAGAAGTSGGTSSASSPGSETEGTPPTDTDTGCATGDCGTDTDAPVAPPIENPKGRTKGSGGPVGRGDLQASDTLRYYYNVPACAVKNAPMPVVYAFYGTNQPPKHLVDSLWGTVPDQECFAVFALYGTSDQGWYLTFDGPDMPLIQELVKYTDAKYDIDKSRRYLEGGSAGAHLVHWFGPTQSQFFSGLFAYAGSLGAAKDAGLWPPGDRVRRIPVFIAHGMDDTTVPYAAGKEAYDEYKRLGFPVQMFDMNGHCCDKRPFPIGYKFLYDNTPK